MALSIDQIENILRNPYLDNFQRAYFTERKRFLLDHQKRESADKFLREKTGGLWSLDSLRQSLEK